MVETDTSEKAFQNNIIAHLVSTGYKSRGTNCFNKATCLDPELVLKFIINTQKKIWEKFERVYAEKSEERFFYSMSRERNKTIQRNKRSKRKDIPELFCSFCNE